MNKTAGILLACCVGVVMNAGCGRNSVREYLTYEEREGGSEAQAEESPSDRSIAEAFSGGGIKPAEDSMPDEPIVLVVHVCGEVNVPGVYELIEGSRVADAVAAAGGFTEKADINYVNQARLLEDGEKIRIPDTEETGNIAAAEDAVYDITGERSSENGGLININTASKEELKSLNGIGDAKADSIIAYRQEYGGFNDTEEIKNVSGIGDSVYNSIKDKIFTG